TKNCVGMDRKEIKSALQRVQTLVDGWQGGEISELERDVALAELRRIYSALRFEGVTTEMPVSVGVPDAEPQAVASDTAEQNIPQAVQNAPEAEQSASESVQQPTVESEYPTSATEQSVSTPEQPAEEVQPIVSEQPAEEVQPIVSEQPAEEVQSDTATLSSAEQAEQAEPAEQAEQTEQAELNADKALFDDKEIVVPRHARRNVILSLYNDDADRTPTASNPVQSTSSDHAQAEGSASESEPLGSRAVLGEVLHADGRTVGDTIVRPKGIAESAPVTSLRGAIGINDRFLLLRDLFGGNEEAYEKAISAIDAFDNLDDCMVHIIENYSWRSGSDGATLIMDLIRRKFGK
ncbi:MAG: hypothetical protein ACI35M_05570, partial [Alistipes sp.]